MTKYATLSTDDFIAVADSIKDRQDYMAWVAQWKAIYKALIVQIRSAKANRKPFLYAYRGRGETNRIVTQPKRTQIGPNPTYSPDAAAARRYLREEADMLMQVRAATKAMGIARKLAERENEAA